LVLKGFSSDFGLRIARLAADDGRGQRSEIRGQRSELQSHKKQETVVKSTDQGTLVLKGFSSDFGLRIRSIGHFAVSDQ